MQKWTEGWRGFVVFTLSVSIGAPLIALTGAVCVYYVTLADLRAHPLPSDDDPPAVIQPR